MKIVVDLNRCRSYGQCVFAAPKVFRIHGEQSLEYDYAPDDALRVQVERAGSGLPRPSHQYWPGSRTRYTERVIATSGQSTATSLDPINRVVIVGASLAGLSAARSIAQ